MPKASAFATIAAPNVSDADWLPLGTNAGDNRRILIPEARQLLGSLGSDTVNAYSMAGATREAKIQAAITYAITNGLDRVFIPTSMLPYDETLVTFTTAVQMVREGGSFDVYDAFAYGASANGTGDDAPAIQSAANGAQVAGGELYMPGTVLGYVFGSPVAITQSMRVVGQLGPVGRRTFIKVTSAGVSPFTVSYIASGTVIEKLALIGPGVSSTVPGIIYTNSNSNLLNEVDIKGFDEGVRYAPGVNASYSNTIRNSIINSNNSININAQAQTHALRLDAVTFGTAPIGLKMVDSNTLCITGGDAESCTVSAIDLDASAPLQVGALIAGVHFENNTSSNGDIRLGQTAQVKGITIVGGGFYPGAGALAGVNAVNVDGLTILGSAIGSGYATVSFLKQGTVANLSMWGVSGQPGIGNRNRYNYGGTILDSGFQAATLFDSAYQDSGAFELYKTNSGAVLAKTYYALLTALNVTNSGAPAAGRLYANGALINNGYSISLDLRALRCNAAFDQMRAPLTYGTLVGCWANTGNLFPVTITNGIAFTIDAPGNPVEGQVITYTLRNASGGAAGVATWHAVFKMAAWVQPATGFSRSITFYYDGTNWVETGRTPADVPN